LRSREKERERSLAEPTERNDSGMEWYGTRSVRIELPNRTRLFVRERLRGCFAALRPRLLERDGTAVAGKRKLDIYVQVRPS